MKKTLIKLAVILLFAAMLFFPEEALSGASSGLLLWFHSVLPTLLPFMIFSDLLIRTHAADWIVRVTGPVLRPVFGVSDYGSFAVVTGFLCGYPMGSKVATDLLKEGRISLPEAKYLLSFCNNASPVFIISYVVLQNLGDKELALPALMILFGSPVLASFLFRGFFLKNNSFGDKTHSSGDNVRFSGDNTHFPGDKIRFSGDKKADHVENFSSPGNLADECIMNGFEMVTKVGGYIMLFSIFLSLAEASGIRHPLFLCLLLPSLEVSNGVSMVCAGGLPPAAAFFLCMVCTSFGGWCAAAQTSCMISGTRLSTGLYIAQKLITAMVTSLLCYLYLIFIC